MSDLATRLQAATPDRPATPFRHWISTLEPTDRAALEAAAVDPCWSTAKLIEFIRSEGCPIGKDTIGTWRRGLGYGR